jgi:hypothetical protein
MNRMGFHPLFQENKRAIEKKTIEDKLRANDSNIREKSED